MAITDDGCFEIFSVYPSQGGSKRLPGKNLINFRGKPLIAWTIEAAMKSQFIDEIIVSTDSQNIADISQQCGVNVPNLRPKHLSGDLISVVDVLINYLKTQDSLPKHVSCFATDLTIAVCKSYR